MSITAHAINYAQISIREHNDIDDTFVVAVINIDNKSIIDEELCSSIDLGRTVTMLYARHSADCKIDANLF